MGKRRKLRLKVPKAVYRGPIAILLCGEDHNMTRDDVIHYVASLMDVVKQERDKEKKKGK